MFADSGTRRCINSTVTVQLVSGCHSSQEGGVGAGLRFRYYCYPFDTMKQTQYLTCNLLRLAERVEFSSACVQKTALTRAGEGACARSSPGRDLLGGPSRQFLYNLAKR